MGSMMELFHSSGGDFRDCYSHSKTTFTTGIACVFSLKWLGSWLANGLGNSAAVTTVES